MIGQKRIINQIDEMFINKMLPQSIILYAAQGMGKKTLAKYVADKLKKDVLFIEPKVGGDGKTKGVRDILELSEQYSTILYVIEDAEDGSPQCKNALLKILEEPPKDCYIILTTTNKKQLPPTILSRCVTFEFDAYTKEELLKFDPEPAKVEIIRTPGLLLESQDVNIGEIKSYCERVLTKMKTNSLSTCLKITNKLETDSESKKKTRKDTDTKYDPLVFLLALQHVNSGMRDNIDRALRVDNLISEFKNFLLLRFALNKRFLMDEFLIKLYKILKEY